ncbi:hypothetical protein [uncultured Trichococcus sp.]|uniref:hypothetical protein n=1 Tax=uncultured Trichococcus sp. TaxID=189665 RepID=UPI0029C7A846|nr:hypothetical protein [uncultured Trichococcus sp.]
MKLYRKIDTTTGNFLEDVLFESHPFLMETVLVDVTDEEGIITQVEEIQPLLDAEGNTQLDPQYIEEEPQQGFYLPRWTGMEWIEGGQAPEPTTLQLSTDEKLTQMAEQLVITQTNLSAAQEALDFLLMGGM